MPMYGIYCKRDKTVFNITDDMSDVVNKCNIDNRELIEKHGAKTMWYVPVKLIDIPVIEQNEVIIKDCVNHNDLECAFVNCSSCKNFNTDRFA